MQPTGSAGTGAGHIAGVLRDARLHQNDVQGWLFVHRCTSPLFCRACRAQARQKRLEPDPVAGILRGGRVLDRKRHELGSVVGGGTQGVALQQRADEHRAVQVAGAGKAAADVQLFDEEAVFSAACTADVFAQRQAGDDSPRARAVSSSARACADLSVSSSVSAGAAAGSVPRCSWAGSDRQHRTVHGCGRSKQALRWSKPCRCRP